MSAIPGGPMVTPQSVRAAYPEWEIGLSGDGYWAAWLTTEPRELAVPRVTGATLRELVKALNEYRQAGGTP